MEEFVAIGETELNLFLYPERRRYINHFVFGTDAPTAEKARHLRGRLASVQPFDGRIVKSRGSQRFLQNRPERNKLEKKSVS